jgi:tetratricopeptide (TPR) repeat protein
VDELVSEGERLLASGNWAQAINAFSKALEIDPDDPCARAGMDRAHDMMDREVADPRPDPDWLIREAELRVARGELDIAIEMFRDAANGTFLAGNTSRYLQVCDRLLHLRPGYRPIVWEAARFRISNGTPREALTILLPCYKQQPDNTTTLELLVDAFAAIGHHDKAAILRQELERARR